MDPPDNQIPSLPYQHPTAITNTNNNGNGNVNVNGNGLIQVDASAPAAANTHTVPVTITVPGIVEVPLPEPTPLQGFVPAPATLTTPTPTPTPTAVPIPEPAHVNVPVSVSVPTVNVNVPLNVPIDAVPVHHHLNHTHGIPVPVPATMNMNMNMNMDVNSMGVQVQVPPGHVHEHEHDHGHRLPIVDPTAIHNSQSQADAVAVAVAVADVDVEAHSSEAMSIPMPPLPLQTENQTQTAVAVTTPRKPELAVASVEATTTSTTTFLPVISTPITTTKTTTNNATSTSTSVSVSASASTSNLQTESAQTQAQAQGQVQGQNPKSSRKQQQRMDGIWYKHLNELKAYKQENGTASVPRKSGQLGEWCRTQRRYYRMYRKGENVPLTKERMRALEALGFIWFPAEERKKRKREASLKALMVKGDMDPTLVGVMNMSMGMNMNMNMNMNNMGMNMHMNNMDGVSGNVDMNGHEHDHGHENEDVNLHVNVDLDTTMDGNENTDAHVDEDIGVGNMGVNLDTKLAAAAGEGDEGEGRDGEQDGNDGPESEHDNGNQIQINMRNQQHLPPHKRHQTHKTQALTIAHANYNASIHALHKSNESLCDAQDLLEKAMERHQQALERQKQATLKVNVVCDEVLKRELEDRGDDEWNIMYKKMMDYKEEHGDILFAKNGASMRSSAKEKAIDKQRNLVSSSAGDTNDVEMVGVDNAGVAAAAEAVDQLAGDEGNSVPEGEGGASATVTASATGIDGEKEGVGEGEGSSASIDEVGAQEVAAREKLENEKILSDWVSSMRKAPRKSVSEWRHKALDKLGFIWNQYDAIWTARYKELIAYKDKWGNTLVATSYPVLGVWVGTQRKQYRLKTKGKYSHMTDERMKLLNEIGFVWEVNTWNEKFEELKHFRMQYGHFLVPTEFPNKQLRPWISTQRSHYRFKQEGKPSQMTDERVNLLNSIGFPWKTKEDWQTRFNELILFFHEHGNLQVPRVYMKAPKLYRWTNCQKMEMQKHAEGQLSRLKPDQIKMLENIGFE